MNNPPFFAGERHEINEPPKPCFNQMVRWWYALLLMLVIYYPFGKSLISLMINVCSLRGSTYKKVHQHPQASSIDLQ